VKAWAFSLADRAAVYFTTATLAAVAIISIATTVSRLRR
jgi:hypothetical protein